MLLHISNGLLIHREDAVLAACLDGHVSDGESVIHRQIFDSLAHEFHGFIKGAVYADHADDVQDYIFTADPFGGLAYDIEFNGGRYLEPGLAGGHACCHVGASHTSGKRAQGSVGTGV